jgi:iron complex outermembrane receptor protein
VTVSAVPPLPGLLAQIQSEVAAQQARGPRLAAMDAGAATISQVNNWGVSNTTTYELNDHITLKNIAGVRKVKTLDQFDLDGTRLQLVQVGGKIDIDQVSDEFQIQGKAFDGNLDYILGAFYFRESGLDLNFNVKSLGYMPDAATGNPFSSGGDLSSVSKSLFGQLNYKFSGIEGLSTTLGLRKTWDERDVDVTRGAQFREGTPFAFCRFNNTAANINPTCTPLGKNHREFSKASWTAGLNYQMDKTLVYGKVSRGYRSGGFDPSASTSAMLVGFEPEVVTEGELGLKSDFEVAAMPVRIASAAYYSKGDNIQRTVRLSQFTTSTSTINAGAAHFWGVELEATVIPFRGLEVSGFYNYNRAIYDTFRDGAGNDLSSNYFTSQPRTKYGVSATYTHDLEGLGEFSIYGTYAFQSRIYFDDLNRSAGIQNGTTQAGYGLLNGGASLKRIGGRPVDATLWVRNLTDELYATNGQTLLGVTAVNWSEPRTYGLTLRYSFGASAN